MDKNKSKIESKLRLNRRNLLKTTGVATGTMIGGFSIGNTAVQDVDAVAPAIAVLGIANMALVGGGFAAGYYSGKEALFHESESATILHNTIYSNSVTDKQDVIRTVNDAYNKMDNTASIARSEGKIIASKQIGAGKSRSEVKSIIEDKLNDYFVEIYKTLFNAQDLLVRQIESNITSIENTTDIKIEDVYQPYEYDTSNLSTEDTFIDYNFTDKTVTLVNGESVTYRTGYLENEANSKYYLAYYDKNRYDDGSYPQRFIIARPPADQRNDTYDPRAQITFANSDNGTFTTTSDQINYADKIIDDIDTARTSAISDVKGIVDDLFDNYNGQDLKDAAGNLPNSTDILINSTENFAETGSPVYAQLVAYEQGYPTSEAGYSMTIEHDGSSYNGTMYGFKPSSGSLETGQSYDPTTDGTNAFFIYQDSDGVVNELTVDGTFTVTDIKDKDGNSVSSVSVYDPKLSASDTSDVVQQLENHQQARKDFDDETPGSGLGAGFFDSLTLPSIAAITGLTVYAAKELGLFDDKSE